MISDIRIDQDKCPTPYECKICLKICPEAVFTVVPTEIERFEETDPNDYEVQPVFTDKCVACMDCVKACPNDAIRVKV